MLQGNISLSVVNILNSSSESSLSSRTLDDTAVCAEGPTCVEPGHHVERYSPFL